MKIASLGRWSCLLFVVLVLPVFSAGGSSGCGGGGFGGTLVSGSSDVEVSTENATLLVPGGSFASTLRVKMNEETADLSSITGSTALTNAVNITFSDNLAVVGVNPMQLRINVPSTLIQQAFDEGSGIYALVRVNDISAPDVDPMAQESDVPTDTGDDAFTGGDWEFAMGEYDETNSTMTVSIEFAAESFEVAVAAGSDFLVYTNESQTQKIAASVSGAPASLRKVTIDMISLPWVVVCQQNTFEGTEQSGYCNPLSADFQMDNVLQALDDVTLLFGGKGWREAKLIVTSGANVARTGLPSLPSFIGALADDSAQFLMVIFSRTALCGDSANNRGCYNPVTGRVAFAPGALDADQQNAGGNNFAHEIFHAVQAVRMPSIHGPGYRWIKEGMAVAVGFWALDPDNESSLRSRRWSSAFRDWRFPLNADQDNSAVANSVYLPYRTFEFFALFDEGSVDNFGLFMSTMGGFGRLEPYTLMDQTLTDIFAVGLDDFFIQRVLSQRGATSGYDRCDSVDIGAENQVLSYDLLPMSSQCVSVSADVESATDCILARFGDETDVTDLALLSTDDLVTGGNSFVFLGQPGMTIETLEENLQIFGDAADLQIIDLSRTRSNGVTRRVLLDLLPDEGCAGSGLTGVWCASTDFDDPGSADDDNDSLGSADCSDWTSFLRLIQTEGNLSGDGLVGVCEDIGVIDFGTVVGETVTVEFDEATFYEGGSCQTYVILYNLELDLDTGNLVGTINFNGNIRDFEFVKISNSPSFIPPFCEDDPATAFVEECGLE